MGSGGILCIKSTFQVWWFLDTLATSKRRSISLDTPTGGSLNLYLPKD